MTSETEEGLARMKAQVYKDPRPKEHFDVFHERVRRSEPKSVIYETVHLLTFLYASIFFRLRCISADKVPLEGPVIIAPNHFSFMDHFFVGMYVRRRVQYMAKSQLFTPPAQFVYTHGGVFPVRRGHADTEAFTTAETVLGRGGTIVMYCEGGRSRTGQLAERARRGIGRLALSTGAPVVPVAIHGSSRVRNWKKLQFPKVTVQYGDPFRFEPVAEPTRYQEQAVADEIFDEIKALYAGLEQHGRKGAIQRAREQRRTAATA